MTLFRTLKIWYYRRRYSGFQPHILSLLLFLILLLIYYSGRENAASFSCEDNARNNYERLLNAERRLNYMTSVLRRHSISEIEYLDSTIPVIYVITPTYKRPQQKAELTRMKNVLLHVSSIYWIVVEDSDVKTKLVENFLSNTGIPYIHLSEATPEKYKLKENDPGWLKPKGIPQRNAGIHWLRKTLSPNVEGVVYFADDDNTYSIDVFNEMRGTKMVSVWPVGLAGGVMAERPKVVNGEVVGWITGWKPDRPFAIDMAGFAINVKLLLRHTEVNFSYDSQRGVMESDFLKKLVVINELEPKADYCTKVLVWHTQTISPNLKDEEKLKFEEKAVNIGIEV